MPTSWRRPMCIILVAGPGDIRAAKGLVGRALREALGIRRWGDKPHFVTYYSRDAMPLGEEPRFTLEASNDEREAFCEEARRLAKLEGWTRAPIDVYHD